MLTCLSVNFPNFDLVSLKSQHILKTVSIPSVLGKTKLTLKKGKK